jgi:SAM-dependent methyltransferase
MTYLSRWAVLSLAVLAPSASAQWDDFGGDVPYVPTPPAVVEAMLKLGGIQASDFVIDLGCGDGRIVVMAAEKFGAKGIGYDLNPQRISEANDNAQKAGVTGRAKFIEKNLFEADVSQATLVTLYLLPDVNLRLRPKLLGMLKNGSRIVSHSFDMGDWKPDQKVEINGKTLLFWEVNDKARAQFGEPAKTSSVDGEWTYTMQSPMGEVKADLTLKTDGSKLAGVFLFPEGRKLEISEGSIQGDELTFTVKRDRQSGGTMVYRMKAKASGNAMEGKATTEMEGQSAEMTWSARRK